MRERVIDVGSAEYNSMFTADGKLDFNSRKGLRIQDDPLNHVGFKPDARDGRVEFAEQREFREALTSTHRVIDIDDEDSDLNEKW